jgi:hypothetical protein
MLLPVPDRLVGPLDLKQNPLFIVVPLGTDLGVGVGSAMELASAHVHMIVLIFDCVILSLPSSY